MAHPYAQLAFVTVNRWLSIYEPLKSYEEIAFTKIA